MIRRILFAALFTIASAADAQTPQRAEVQQKAMFVKRLIEASAPAAPAAAELHARALQHLERAELREAEARLNEAIRMLQLSRRPAQPAGRYEALVSSIGTMRETYLRYAAAREDPHGALIAEVDEALARAKALERNDAAAALHVLAQAEQAMTHALTQALGSLTVSYAPAFSGPQDEFRFEQSRHRAYAALVPAALHELRPGPAALTLVQRYFDSGEAMAARAAGEAGKGDWRSALDSVRSATTQVQRALGAAGLALPEDTP